jgi:N-acetylmuramidase/Putative peptidoglycan binding domain
MLMERPRWHNAFFTVVWLGDFLTTSRSEKRQRLLVLIPFQGTAWALSADGIAATGDKLGVSAAEIWTVLAVETSGCGYLPDRRPQICFERHIFHRLTHGTFDDGDISDPTPGGYGALGGHQYERLNLAMVKDRDGALQSASWGIGQIMGENFGLSGYSSVGNFLNAMLQSEDDQLRATADFLINKKLHFALQAHDWTSFARRYNGPEYAINRYDQRLYAAYGTYSAGSVPDLDVRATQLYLTYLGFDPGTVDGISGRRTSSALADFNRRAGIAQGNVINAELVARLKNALSYQVAAAG